MKKYVSKPLHFAYQSFEHKDQRFDLILRGVDHLGCSYEGRVFVNNPDADENTPPRPENGYAGSYHIFGHGDCYGAPGHCDPPTPRLPYDTTPPPQSLPNEVHVDVTEALVKAVDASPDKTITISVVPIVRSQAPGVTAQPEDALKIAGPVLLVGYA